MSTQTIRTYERWGLIPPSSRRKNGYRQYEELHVHALHAVRAMAGAYGLIYTRKIMSAIYLGDIETTLDLIDRKHGDFHHERVEIQKTITLLRTSADTMVNQSTVESTDDTRHIHQVAHELGIQPSTIRFWEKEGLVQPKRHPINGYRLFDSEIIRAIRIIHLLRNADYGVDAVRPILDELRRGNPERALKVAEKRLLILRERSRMGIVAMAKVDAYLSALSEKGF